MDKNRTFIFGVLGGVALVIMLILFGVFSGGQQEDSRLSLEGEIDFWGVFDNQVAYRQVINSFNTIYPEVTVNYRKFNSIESYERTLLDSLAAGEGPDVFMVRNNDIARKVNKITPVPSNKYSLIDLRNQFPDIVEDNFAFDGKNIFALPLSIDTLSLIYNKGLFNENDVVFPPETWTEFQQISQKITKVDSQNKIQTAGSAMGGASNIDRSKDILSMLMIQRGADVDNGPYSSPSFDIGNRLNHPLNFYSSFGKENSENYTWNSNMDNSLQEFKNGNVGMIFNYHSALSEIKNQYPYLNVEVAEVPQFEDGKNSAYANYWGYTVSRQTDMPNVAWDFILTMTTRQPVAESYLNVAEKPPALSKLIQDALENPDLNIYASQILRAESWIEPDPERVTQIFHNVINRSLEGGSASSLMNQASSQINDLINEL